MPPPGADTIVLAAGTYSFGTAVIWDFGPNALPVITSAITIEGNGTVLTSTNPVRLRFFYVAGNGVGGLPTGTLTVSNVPEPASALLLAIGTSLALSSRGRIRVHGLR